MTNGADSIEERLRAEHGPDPDARRVLKGATLGAVLTPLVSELVLQRRLYPYLYDSLGRDTDYLSLVTLFCSLLVLAGLPVLGVLIASPWSLEWRFALSISLRTLAGTLVFGLAESGLAVLMPYISDALRTVYFREACIMLGAALGAAWACRSWHGKAGAREKGARDTGEAGTSASGLPQLLAPRTPGRDWEERVRGDFDSYCGAIQASARTQRDAKTSVAFLRGGGVWIGAGMLTLSILLVLLAGWTVSQWRHLVERADATSPRSLATLLVFACLTLGSILASLVLIRRGIRALVKAGPWMRQSPAQCCLVFPPFALGRCASCIQSDLDLNKGEVVDLWECSRALSGMASSLGLGHQVKIQEEKQRGALQNALALPLRLVDEVVVARCSLEWGLKLQVLGSTNEFGIVNDPYHILGRHDRPCGVELFRDEIGMTTLRAVEFLVAGKGISKDRLYLVRLDGALCVAIEVVTKLSVGTHSTLVTLGHVNTLS